MLARSWNRVRDERGIIALPLAVIVLVVLGVLVATFLTLSAVEPRISQNLTDTTRARYVAEAGIEWAFNTLVASSSWSEVLLAASNNAGYMVQAATLPGLAASSGTFSIQVRNDNQAGDNQITGQLPEPLANVTNDSNGIVIVAATGTINGATQQVEVAVQRLALPPFPGAVNLPGLQADTFINNTNFDIDGRDYLRTGGAGPGPLKWGVQTSPGVQQNVGNSYEANTQNGFNTGQKQNNVKGKHQDTGAFTTGLSTVAPDGALSPTNLGAFLNQLAAFPATTVLQSTMACPMVMTGNAADPSQAALTNGCGLNQALELGTPSDPKLVYFRGDLDPTSTFNGLTVTGPVRGAGILVVEDGDLRMLSSSFRWDGIVLVVGKYVGAGFRAGSNSTVYGAFAAMETVWNEAPGFFEFLLGATSATFRNSKQNIDMVQTMRALHKVSNWREK